MSRRRYEGATSRGRRDYSRSSSSEYYRRSLGKSRARRRDMSPLSDSERFRSSRHRRERDGRRPRSAHARRYSLDDSDAVYHDRRRRRRSSYDDDRRGGSRRHERRSDRRSSREKALKDDIKFIFELFADVVEMVNSEKKIIDRMTGQSSRSSIRLPKLRLDEDQSAKMMLHKLYDNASLINKAVGNRSRMDFFLRLDESNQSPRHERSKYRDGRGSRSRYGSDREYGRRSDRGYRDRGYDDDRDYDRHRGHRNHRSHRR